MQSVGPEEKVAPDPESRFRYLFNGNDSSRYENLSDIDGENKRLSERRTEAIRSVFQERGLEGVIEFATKVEHPIRVGNSLGALGLADNEIFPQYLSLDDSKLSQFVRGYAWARFYTADQWTWAKTTVKGPWTPDQITIFLTLLPFQRPAWEMASSLLPDENAYWKLTPSNPYSSQDCSELTEAIPKLLSAGRLPEALDCIDRMLMDSKDPNPKDVLNVLNQILTPKVFSFERDAHAAIKAITWLQKNPAVDLNELLLIEWAYLPVFNPYGSGVPVKLHAQLSENPAFFDQSLRTLLGKVEGVAPDAGQKVYRLLDSWKLIPGTQDDGTVSYEILASWLKEAKNCCERSGILDAGLSTIGKMLSHSHRDPDGTWISHAVAKALNEADMGPARHGFRIALYNRRGVHGFSKGKEERALSDGYKSQALEIEAKYPRLAATMFGLADDYTREADREEKRDPYAD